MRAVQQRGTILRLSTVTHEGDFVQIHATNHY